MVTRTENSPISAEPLTTEALIGRQPAGDYYRALMTQLRRLSSGHSTPLRTIGITSCAHGEGVTTVATNLAMHVAREHSQPVLLIDASASQTSIRHHGGRRQHPGLLDVLNGDAQWCDCIQKARESHLELLGMGQDDMDDLDERPDGFRRLRNFCSRYGLVVVDMPVASDLTSTLALAGMLDGMLLVVEAERVRNQVIHRVKQQLDRAGANLLGVVFNKRRNHVPDWLYNRI